ncbi:MAG TPA: hypothetical protein VFL75_01775 [Candidatus Limnocylindria bacterium]|nr:hypothetical protein [Candidatus Limnocylindria bacterium]
MYLGLVIAVLVYLPIAWAANKALKSFYDRRANVLGSKSSAELRDDSRARTTEFAVTGHLRLFARDRWQPLYWLYEPVENDAMAVAQRRARWALVALLGWPFIGIMFQGQLGMPIMDTGPLSFWPFVFALQALAYFGAAACVLRWAAARLGGEQRFRGARWLAGGVANFVIFTWLWFAGLPGA